MLEPADLVKLLLQPRLGIGHEPPSRPAIPLRPPPAQWMGKCGRKTSSLSAPSEGGERCQVEVRPGVRRGRTVSGLYLLLLAHQ